MSEGQAQAAPASGATILTGGVPAAPVQRGVEPADQAQGAAQDAIAQSQRASQRPEWVPEKFWKADTGEVDSENLGKSYLNLEKLIGRDKVPVPLNDEDAEGWDRWARASGRPDNADGYEFKRPESLPDGLSYDEDLETSFRQTVFELGLNKRQAAALHERYVKTQTDRFASHHKMQQENRAKIESDIRREYGATYDAKVQRAKEALATFADAEYRQWLDETGSGNDPRVIRAWIKVGEKMGGDTRLKGTPSQAENPVNHEKAIADFRSRHKDALFDRAHVDHDRRVKELQQMYEGAFA